MRSGGARVAVSLSVAFVLAGSVACSKSDDAKPVHSFELNVRPGPQPVSPQNAEGVDAAAFIVPYPRVAGRANGDDKDQTVTPGVGVGAVAAASSRPAGSAAPAASSKGNPDDAVLAQARVTLGRCFASLPTVAGAGDRSAHVSFTVVATGTVSHADVSSEDTTEGPVLDCLQQTAQATTFSDNGNGPLRTYAIDVRVHASPVNGGR